MDVDDTVLLVIDVQGRLARIMHDHERLLHTLERVLKVAALLNVPVVCTEQAPEKLGATAEAITQLLPSGAAPIAKRTFSAWGCEQFREKMNNGLGRQNVLICGIETHVCVYQTARDLHRHGYKVTVIADAVSSRAAANTQTALSQLRHLGVGTVSGEMAICELLKTADHPKFREVMAHIK